MSLPIFTSQDRNFSLMQTNWASQLNPVIQLPINQGHILKAVRLVTGSNTINHLLGRPLQGWFPVRIRAQATLSDTQDANQYPELTLLITTSADVVVDLFVF